MDYLELFLIKIPNLIHLGTHIDKERICQCDCCHRFYYNHCSWDNDRVVAAMDFQRKRFFIFGYGLLRLADGWGWLDMGAEYDLTAVTDSSHDSTCVIGGFDNFTVFDCESIIVGGTV